MLKRNMDIRAMAKNNGVFLWEIAELLEVSEQTFFRKLRRELSDEDKAGFGFTKTEAAKLINWIICPRNVPIAVSKTDGVKIFDPATTQGADAWTIEYRKFHDLWVKDKQLPTIRVSVAE